MENILVTGNLSKDNNRTVYLNIILQPSKQLLLAKTNINRHVDMDMGSLLYREGLSSPLILCYPLLSYEKLPTNVPLRYRAPKVEKNPRHCAASGALNLASFSTVQIN